MSAHNNTPPRPEGKLKSNWRQKLLASLFVAQLYFGSVYFVTSFDVPVWQEVAVALLDVVALYFLMKLLLSPAEKLLSEDVRQE